MHARVRVSQREKNKQQQKTHTTIRPAVTDCRAVNYVRAFKLLGQQAQRHKTRSRVDEPGMTSCDLSQLRDYTYIVRVRRPNRATNKLSPL